MSGLYDDLAEVSRVKKEVVNPSSLYADLTVGPEKTNNAPRQEPLPTQAASQKNAPIVNQNVIPKSYSTSYQTNALFVGNLKWWTRDQDLLNIFSQFGTVTALKIHADKVNGKSKGYAYIEYSSENIKAAGQAKEKLHGFMLHGGKLSITFASPDKIKLPEFSNTPYVPANPIPQAVVSRTQTAYAPRTTTQFQDLPQPLMPGLPLPTDFNPLNSLQYGMKNTSLLKQFKLNGGNLNALLNTLRKQGDSSGSRSRSSSYTRSRSRSYSRSQSRSPSQRQKGTPKRRRIVKSEISRKERPMPNRDRGRDKDRGWRDRSREHRGRRRN